VGLDVGNVLEVDPSGVQLVASGLRARHLAVVDQRWVTDRIEVSHADNIIGVELESFTSLWASAMMALARELDLLGMELGKSAQAVAAVDWAGRDERL
jgi:hypothetical protein